MHALAFKMAKLSGCQRLTVSSWWFEICFSSDKFLTLENILTPVLNNRKEKGKEKCFSALMI